MVIIQTKTGQLANRLFLFGHFIASSIEYGYRLWNPAFEEYERYFPAVRQNDFGHYPISVRRKLGLPFPLMKVTAGILSRLLPASLWHEVVLASSHPGGIDLSEEGFVDAARRKVVIAAGWEFRDFRSFEKHGDVIRQIFLPDASVLSSVERFADGIKEKADILIGVHVRRGDYRTWQDGKYYWGDRIYAEKIQQMETHLAAAGKTAAFALCSNEPVDLQHFRGTVRMGPGSMIEDLYLLSKCDMIIGPPSTFSLWASFHGRVPLLHLSDGAEHVRMDGFSVARG